jgi:diguanylate cyclase (GGDEF)-like protein/PAS domain S-box-containing protein
MNTFYNIITKLTGGGWQFLTLIIIFALIIISILIIFNYKNIKKRKLIGEKEFQNILIYRLKRINILRDKGVISKEDFENKREQLFQLAYNKKRSGNKILKKESIEKYCLLIERAEENIIIIQGKIIKFVNQKVSETMGFLKNELDLTNILEYIHPNDKELFMDYQLKKIKGERITHNKAIRFIDKKGDIKWFEPDIVPISLHGKSATLNFLTDITDIKYAEKELQETQDRYFTLFEDSPIPLWELDISEIKEYFDCLKDKGVTNFGKYFKDHPEVVSTCAKMLRIININKANCNMFGAESKERTKDYLNHIFSNKLHNELIKWFIYLAEGKNIFESEFKCKTLKEQEKHMVLKWSVISTDIQEYTKAIVSIIDLTKLKEATEQIQDLSQLRESIIDNANVWLTVFDNDFNIIVWNKAAEKISGYLHSEVMGSNKIWEQLYPDEVYRNQTLAKTLAIIEEKKTVEDFETIILNKNGKDRIITWNFKTLNDTNDRIIGLIALGRDFTDKKKMEEELKFIATHDSLTGLYNRTFFEEQMKIQFGERYKKAAIIILDIDGLKYVNDSLGHLKGDNLIKNTAKILKSTFRPSDVAARIGGDEFSILMKDIDEDGVINTLGRLKTNIDKFNQNLKRGQNPVNISIGYALRDYHAKTVEKTFKEADDMLFENKIPKKEEVKKSTLNIIKATMFEKDSITEEHMERLKDIAISFALVKNFDNKEEENLVLATELHDIGKVSIPDNILNKSSTLTQEEFGIVRKHTLSGYRIAESTLMISKVSKYILHSHERWDGAGYPDGLKGEEIPEISRMVHIIDSYDVMIHDRPYKNAMSEEEAVIELKKCSGTQFDPLLVNIFVNNVLKNKETQYKNKFSFSLTKDSISV